MITVKEFPDIQFSSKEDLFKALRENADKIISLKCADVVKSCDKGGATDIQFLERLPNAIKGIDMKQDCVYPVINTTKYLDSHNDVHMDGIWNKSAKEQNGKVYYVADHELKLQSIIAYPSNVNVMLKSVPWGVLGKDFEGETEALIYEIPKSAIVNQLAKKAIEEKVPMQNSVRMQYVKIKLALNSTAKEDLEYKKTYDETIDLIANKAIAEANGYFWAVYEAKIHKEGSMVLFGSNDSTPILTNGAANGTSEDKNEPEETTQSKLFQLILEKL
jgi:hypothetical protein